MSDQRSPGAPPLSLLALCLVASGAAGLVYEVLWLRQLSLVMGHTVYALAAVLDAFLGGLALGAWLAGRYAQRRRVSLALYAALELGIALGALAMPYLIAVVAPLFGAAYNGLGDAFVAYNLVQFLVCGLILLAPTVLMGATLPVAMSLVAGARARADAAVGVEAGGEVGARAGKLYAANSFGGALGAALCGFVLLPGLGMRGTSYVAASLNAAVALLAFLYARRARDLAGADAGARPVEPARAVRRGEARESAQATERAAWPSPSLAAIVALYCASGFAALVLEVAWARVVSLSIGSTTYGFTIILTTYIAGLSLGSYLAPKLRALREDPVRGVVVLHALIALWSLATLSYLGSLPVRIVEITGDQSLTFGALLRAETLLVGATILVPTLAMGALFPLVTSLVHRALAARSASTSPGDAGRSLGSTYAANTLGNILGSFVAGFVLVPAIGMRSTIVVASALSALVALGYLLPAIGARRRAALASAGVLAAAVAVAAVFAPQWNKEVITSGPYLYGRHLLQSASKKYGKDPIRQAMEERFELVDYREGATTVVTVKKERNIQSLHLQVGGKSDAFSYASTQNFIAHVPLLLHPDPKDVLIVGLGSGSTLGSALNHAVQSVECIEISPEVRDMARAHFGPYTGNALENPRARVRIADGRNHLRHTRSTYDVIVSQPSNPWMSGAAGCFTREYFEDVRAHLKPGGVACIWFLFYADDGAGMRSVMRTWQEVFPEAYLFDTLMFNEYALIGLRDPAPFSAARAARGLATPGLGPDIGRFAVTEPADLYAHLLLGPAGVRAYSAGAVVNTDDNAHVELRGPRVLQEPSTPEMVRELSKHRADPTAHVAFDLADPADAERSRARLSALARCKQLVLEARAMEETEGQTARWQSIVREAHAIEPRDPYLAGAMRRIGTKPASGPAK